MQHVSTNGTTCQVQEIIYLPGRKPPSVPDAVLVHCPDYKGPSFSQLTEKIVPITPIARHWIQESKKCMRTMIPLDPAYALTIHKSQGMSIDRIMVNLSDREFSPGLSYVALSRCRKISNLAIRPYPNWVRFKKLFERNDFRTRIQEDKRAKQMEERTIAKGYLG